MSETPKPHTYALGTRVTFEDPSSGWVDYVTGEIVELLDTGEYRVWCEAHGRAYVRPGYLLAPLDGGESGVVG